jgi:hypothetical protein
MSKAALKTFDYANGLSSDVTALHISSTPAHTELLKKKWEELGIGVPLEIITDQYRDIIQPLERYIAKRESELEYGQKLTVVLTKFVGAGWHNQIYHNQTTFFIESKLSRHKNVITVLVPYVLS